MKTVVIHVGTHKTGTTALQLFFSRNSDRLREHDIHYVSAGRGGWHLEAHHALAVALREGQSRVPAQVVKEVKSSTCSKILLSSEMFMEFEAPRTLQALFSDCRVQIVMYVRRQDLRALSEYNYAVKIFVARFPGVVQDYYLCKRYLRWLDYHLQLERYAVVFGRKNVLARVCEQGVDGSSIYKDFLDVLEAPWSSEYDLATDDETNRSLSLPCLEFKRLCNKAVMTNEEDSRLAAALGSIHMVDTECAGQSLLSPAERIAIVERYDESNRLVAEDYLDRDELFAQPLPGLDAKWKPFAGLQHRDLERVTSQLVEKGGYTQAEVTNLVQRMTCAASSDDWQRAPANVLGQQNPWFHPQTKAVPTSKVR